jgi:hypothetical protein
MNIYAVDPNSRTFIFYELNHKTFCNLLDIYILKFHFVCSNLLLFCFSTGFYCNSYRSENQQWAHHSNWEQHVLGSFVMCSSSILIIVKYFSTNFQMSVSSKNWTCTVNIVLYNNFKVLNLWDSRKPYNSRTTQK